MNVTAEPINQSFMAHNGSFQIEYRIEIAPCRGEQRVLMFEGNRLAFTLRTSDPVYVERVRANFFRNPSATLYELFKDAQKGL